MNKKVIKLKTASNMIGSRFNILFRLEVEFFWFVAT